MNYPNPFNPSTVIEYNLKYGTHVSLKVFDELGREAAELVDSFQNGGAHQIMFKAAGLASGIYYYKLDAGGSIFVRKMILQK